MTDDRLNIARYVGSLARRERVLLVVRIGLSLATLAATLVLVAVAAAARHWDRPLATAGLLVMAGVGAWFLGAAPALGGWRRSGSLVRQARLVEAEVPDLHGRLLVTVERLSTPPGEESVAIADLAARRARAQLAKAPPNRIHPATPLRGQAAVAAVAWWLAALAALLSPLGVWGTFAWWFATRGAATSLDAAQLAGAEDPARVGDLVLRYVYPVYTGLDPHVVTNGTGDAHGPPGTIVEVAARAADPVDAAALHVRSSLLDGAPDDAPLEATIGEDHRALAGQFSIGADEGAWRILTWRGGEMSASRSFKILPEPDLAPEVQLDAPSAVLQVAADEPMQLAWRARDDFGLSRVGLELDGLELDKPLAAPLQRTAQLTEGLLVTPASLGLAAGDRVKVAVVAWDNDDVSGHKAGRSREIEVVVLGPNGLDARAQDRQEELRKLLLHALADFLEEQYPAGHTGGAVTKWGEAVAHRYDGVDTWYASTWADRRPRTPQDRLELRVYEDVSEARTRLVRFTQVSFVPGSDTPVKPADETTLGELRSHAVVGLENGILLLDRMLMAAIMQNVQERAELLGEVARDVKSSLQQDMSAQEMLTRLDHLERGLKQLLSETEKLPPGGLNEFTNQRGSEMRSLSEAIKQALEKGDLDEARELMARLADQMDQLSDGILDQMDDAGRKEDEFQQQAKDVLAEMKKLEADQRELQEEIRTAREQDDAQTAAEAERAWKELAALAEAHVQNAQEYAHGLDDAGRPFNEQERARDGVDRSTHLQDAITAKDLRSSQRAVDDAIESWLRAEWMREMQDPNGTAKGPGATESEALQRELAKIKRRLDDIPTEGGTPAAQQAARDREGRQQALSERLEQLKQDAEQLSQQMTISPEGVQENLGEAGESMQSAAEDLGDGKPMPAEGSQGTAADRVKAAREALQQALQSQSQSGKRPKGGEEGEGNPSNGEEEDGSETSLSPVEIPDPESFRTPEEYRKELLEGMQADVPDEYEALKKRYYEELVKQ